MIKKLVTAFLALLLVGGTAAPAFAASAEDAPNDGVAAFQTDRDRAEAILSARSKAFREDGSRKTPFASSVYYSRFAGKNRYETAALICQDLRRASWVGDTVIVANGENYADALSASSLAGASFAPILLTPAKTLSSETADQIKAMKPIKVYIVGGTGAVSDGVVNKIKALSSKATVTRLSGKDRYATSYQIAVETTKIMKSFGYKTHEVFVARGDGFADGLSLSAPGARLVVPILLTPTKVLDSNAAKYIRNNPIQRVYVAGGTGAVSAGTVTAISNIGCATNRWYGDNRYATSAKVVEKVADGTYTDGTIIGIGSLGVASGENFPDGLAGGAAIGMIGMYEGSLLLTSTKSLSPEAKSVITKYKADIPGVVIYGGTGAVSKTAENSIKSILK